MRRSHILSLSSAELKTKVSFIVWISTSGNQFSHTEGGGVGWTSTSDFDIVQSQQNNYCLPWLFVTVQILCKSRSTYLFQENSDSLTRVMYNRELGESTALSSLFHVSCSWKDWRHPSWGGQAAVQWRHDVCRLRTMCPGRAPLNLELPKKNTTGDH